MEQLELGGFIHPITQKHAVTPPAETQKPEDKQPQDPLMQKVADLRAQAAKQREEDAKDKIRALQHRLEGYDLALRDIESARDSDISRNELLRLFYESNEAFQRDLASAQHLVGNGQYWTISQALGSIREVLRELNLARSNAEPTYKKPKRLHSTAILRAAAK